MQRRFDTYAFGTQRVPVFFPPVHLGGTAEKVFEKNKKPLEAKVFACYLYLHGPSFEQTARLLRALVKVAKSAVWYWFQQVGAEIGESIVSKRRRRFLVVDETKIGAKKKAIFGFSQQ